MLLMKNSIFKLIEDKRISKEGNICIIANWTERSSEEIKIVQWGFVQKQLNIQLFKNGFDLT